MSWIEQSREERAIDVKRVFNRILSESPDRIWLSKVQEGPQTQFVHLQLPVTNEDVLYDFHVMTAQLKASQMAAYELGQQPGQRLAIIPALLDRLGMVPEESFEIRNDHDTGIRVDVILDVDGLTHEVIEGMLLTFIHNEYVPPRLRPINPVTLVNRMLSVRDEGLAHNFPLF
ncbi:hypothetical protein ACOK4R_35515 (plasmid) [Pseudomonas fluorescens]|uniref:hypothetical protein n=1 Tax=Pseudomonas TaxID=286 RepID=UPI001F1331DF|nr:hypothetical protein [Pseudomonas viridiflava]